MKFEALLSGNFASLGVAVTDWGQMLTKLTDLADDADTQLSKRAEKANWAGENAAVSRIFVAKTAKEFRDAVKEATSIHSILRDARDDLIKYREELKTRIDTAQRERNLTVKPAGDGWTASMNIHPDRAGKGTQLPEHAQGDVDALSADIKRILKNATEVDNAAATALRTLVDSTPYGFADAKYTSLDQAEDALKKADAALKLAEKGDKLSNKELANLNKLFRNNGDDPLFAERFATKLGPKGTLDFYTDVANSQQFSRSPRDQGGLPKDLKERMKLLGGLEDSLGTTLATATQSGSPAMEKWEDGIIAAGGKSVGHTGQGVYGFQAMSNLLRHGKFESEFLLQYGKELTSFEKEHTQDKYSGQRNPRTLREDVLPWERDSDPFQLHYGAANDAGADPMTGFMEALGHNPDASTEFFKDDSNFDYFTEERKWPEDHADLDAKKVAGYTALGHALESGTMGVAYDDPHPQLHRDADTAAVAEKVIELYGREADGNDDKQTLENGAQLMHHQDGIGKSLGRIGAAYIDDLNWGLDGSDDDRSLFAQDGTGRSPRDRAHFDTEKSLRFLGTLGQDPDAYADIGAAQQAYTTSVLDAHPPTLEADGDVSSADAETAITTGAEVQGAIDRGRGDQIKAEGAARDEAYNAAVDRRVGNEKAVYRAITGGVLGMVPKPDEGAAKLLVPLGFTATEHTINQNMLNNLDGYAKSQHRDLSAVYQGDVSRLYDVGVEASWQPGRSTLEEINASGNYSDEQYRELKKNLMAAQKLGYATGSHAQEFAGNLPVTD